jgi:hypothetical protein
MAGEYDHIAVDLSGENGCDLCVKPLSGQRGLTRSQRDSFTQCLESPQIRRVVDDRKHLLTQEMVDHLPTVEIRRRAALLSSPGGPDGGCRAHDREVHADAEGEPQHGDGPPELTATPQHVLKE